jgi:acetyl esterase/lipase
VLTEVLSQAALRCADGKPFVLLGQSAGGLLAHAVAARLERDGVSPAGVALLDSFVPADMSPRMARALAHSSGLVLRSARYDDEAITAASVYTEMLRQWQARELGAPTLVVRPSAPVQGPPAQAPLTPDDCTTRWPLDHVEVEVPGDHFTMNIDFADQTADEVLRWISGLRM